MKLEDYVRETLLAIIRGVTAAQSDETHGPLVARASSGGGPSDLQGNTLTTVSFDLATTSEDRGTMGGEISVVKVVSGKGSTSTMSTVANRIQFSVPLALPKPETQREEDAERNRRSAAAIQHRGVAWS